MFQAKPGDAEVVVINNNSTDDTAAMLEGFMDVTVGPANLYRDQTRLSHV